MSCYFLNCSQGLHGWESDDDGDMDDEDSIVTALGCLGPLGGLLAPEIQRYQKHLKGKTATLMVVLLYGVGVVCVLFNPPLLAFYSSLLHLLLSHHSCRTGNSKICCALIQYLILN